MKFFLACLFSVISVNLCLKDEQIELLKKSHMECFNETQVDPALIIKLKSGRYWSIKNRPLKEWVLCLLKKLDLMSNEGVFRLDTAMGMVPPRDQLDVEDFIDECLPKTGGNPYDIAWSYAKCYHLKSKDHRHKKKNLHYLELFY